MKIVTAVFEIIHNHPKLLACLICVLNGVLNILLVKNVDSKINLYYLFAYLFIFQEFQEKVKNSNTIKEVSSKIDFGLYVLHAAQKQYIEEWKTFNRLWEADKTAILTEYKSKKWEASCFEDDINE